MHLHPSVWISCTVEMLTWFAVNAKHPYGPMTPKTICSEWIALQTHFVILYHPIHSKGPFNQQNKEPIVYHSCFKTCPDCWAIWSGFGCPVNSDGALTVHHESQQGNFE